MSLILRLSNNDISIKDHTAAIAIQETVINGVQTSWDVASGIKLAVNTNTMVTVWQGSPSVGTTSNLS
jgi:hypothetical protein